MKKNNKGITMVVLIITIVVILIITATMIISISNYTNASALMNMQADVQMLKDKAIVYYNSYGEVPGCDETYSDSIDEITIYKINEDTNIGSGFIESKDSEDGNVYYQIDVTKLKDVTLNFGSQEDVFIINERTLNVYYTNGIMSDGEMEYTY